MLYAQETELLCRALASKIGIEVTFSGGSLELARARFYKAAKTDPRFSIIQIRKTTAGTDKLWLVKGSKNISKPKELE